MAKGLVSTSKKRGNYGTPVSYTRQNPYEPKRTTKKSGVKA
jgi:hypothetical protein